MKREITSLVERRLEVIKGLARAIEVDDRMHPALKDKADWIRRECAALAKDLEELLSPKKESVR